MTDAISPARSRRRLPVVIGGAAVLLVAGVAGIVALRGGVGTAGSGGGLLSSGPTVEDAKRICKTAFITEMEQRDRNANAGSSLAVGSLTGIDIEDAQATVAQRRPDDAGEPTAREPFGLTQPSMELLRSLELLRNQLKPLRCR